MLSLVLSCQLGSLPALVERPRREGGARDYRDRTKEPAERMNRGPRCMTSLELYSLQQEHVSEEDIPASADGKNRDKTMRDLGRVRVT